MEDKEQWITQVMGLVSNLEDVLDERAALGNYFHVEMAREAIRAKLLEVVSSGNATEQPKGVRLVNAGALQMVLNALHRDAAEGKVVRGEMADELFKGVEQ